MASARTSGAGDEPSTWPELLFARSASRVNAMTRIRAAATSCAITKLGADAGACLAAPRAMAISPSRPGMSGVWHIPALAGTEREYLLWVDSDPNVLRASNFAFGRKVRLGRGWRTSPIAPGATTTPRTQSVSGRCVSARDDQVVSRQDHRDGNGLAVPEGGQERAGDLIGLRREYSGEARASGGLPRRMEIFSLTGHELSCVNRRGQCRLMSAHGRISTVRGVELKVRKGSLYAFGTPAP